MKISFSIIASLSIQKNKLSVPSMVVLLSGLLSSLSLSPFKCDGTHVGMTIFNEAEWMRQQIKKFCVEHKV